MSNVNIFLNYRRDDDPGFVQATYQMLVANFGGNNVFMDVGGGSLAAGDHFESRLLENISRSHVVLAMIGPRWLQSFQERSTGDRDFVVLELIAAYSRQKIIVPVLIGGCKMPAATDLPDDISWMASLHAVALRMDSFASDCKELSSEIRALSVRTLDGLTYTRSSARIYEDELPDSSIETIRKALVSATKNEEYFASFREAFKLDFSSHGGRTHGEIWESEVVNLQEIIRSVSRFDRLFELDCSRNRQIDFNVDGFHSDTVRELNLSWCELSDISFIDSFPNLVQLDLSWNEKLSNFSPLKKLRDLCEVRVYQTGVREARDEWLSPWGLERLLQT